MNKKRNHIYSQSRVIIVEPTVYMYWGTLSQQTSVYIPLTVKIQALLAVRNRLSFACHLRAMFTQSPQVVDYSTYTYTVYTDLSLLIRTYVTRAANSDLFSVFIYTRTVHALYKNESLKEFDNSYLQTQTKHINKLKTSF